MPGAGRAMKNLKNLTEIAVFLEDVLGKPAAHIFDENMDELIYIVRSQALHNPSITESKMRNKLKRLSEKIIAASLQSFLNENYADDFGDVELNVDEGGIYDRNMKPISAIEKIRKSQREMLNLMVSRCMYEFAKGRNLAKIMDARSNDDGKDPDPKDIDWTPPKAKPLTLELIEIQILRLERKLPNLTSEEGKSLTAFYEAMREGRRKLSQRV